ncbi:hypothetical protein B7R54_13830 [Subtercola boreus]|uniref:Glycosyltransferase subfamily 4-like N-terminal domain-containing protein n=1 Tax=Subtercola boreus TaxID=120213 RepID=A0A3E0VMP2_9MICO|nr:hypothetical protein [Subtercola boreus]RFA10167.1 hypothetical protein B7R54_13830 [Subtercola boreus]TQL52669.1 hypothetical protein FB464_0152 [Subtercola boreus]
MSPDGSAPTHDRRVAVPRQLVLGSMRHAVTSYASELAGALDELAGASDGGGGTAAVRAESFDGAIEAVAGIQSLHLQFTDRLFGTTPARAADLVEALARHARVTVTLHDLPQPSDGAESLARRAAAYARVAEAADAVACNSRHEALLLAEYSAPRLRRDVAVIPLPVGRGAAAAPTAPAPGTPGEPGATGASGGPNAPGTPAAARREAAILGYFYPGKGHAELIAGVAESGLDLAVLALGTAAPGHEAELAAVSASALRRGVRFESTGYLDDHELLEHCRRVAVPVAAHQHLSASASINTWIAAGRRPLVPDGRYSRELHQLRPGTVTVYDPDHLHAALATAAAAPESTWLAPGTSIRPHLPDTAERYLAWWESLG